MTGTDLDRYGRVSFEGVERDVGLAFVPDAKIGDFVIVHVGYAIAILDEEAAQHTLALLNEIDNQQKNPLIDG